MQCNIRFQRRFGGCKHGSSKEAQHNVWNHTPREQPNDTMVFASGKIVQGGADVPLRAGHYFFVHGVVSSSLWQWAASVVFLWMRAWPTMAVGIGRIVVMDLAWSWDFPKTVLVYDEALGELWWGGYGCYG